MTLKTTRWDITGHLGTDAEIAAYLEAVFEAGNPDEIRAALGHVTHARLYKGGLLSARVSQ
jgi:probable addiction module antidote protein